MKHLILAALAGIAFAMPAVAQEPAAAENTVVREEKIVEGADSDAAKLVNDCSARKFETNAELEKHGRKRVTKLKLCSVAGADDMAWIKTLENARTRVAAMPDLSAESRAKIEAELGAEIDRLNKAMGH